MDKPYDWKEIADYYNKGHSYTECKIKFGFAIQTWAKTIKRGERVPRDSLKMWKDGYFNGSKSNGEISSTIRNYILQKYANKCSRCGWSEINSKTKKVPVQIEHIDGHFDNNKEDNLTVLCPNCHSLTATFGGSNRGNGRKYRYKSRN